MKIINRLAKDHTTLAVLLGLCPALALTTKFETAYLLVICVLGLLISSYLINLTIGRFFTGKARLVFGILVVASLVAVLEYLLSIYFKDIFNAFSIYLPLLAVNIIILDRYTLVETKVKRNLFDIVRLVICFSLTILAVAFIRELFGTGVLTLMDLTSSITGYRSSFQIFSSEYMISILKDPAGGFLIFAFIIALFRYLREEKKNG